MGKITKNYLYNLGYQLFAMLVPIVTAPYLARVLGADSLGIYGYVNSSANIVFTVSMLGTYAYGNRQIAYTRNDPEQMNCVFWEVLLARIILGVFGTIFFFIFAIANPNYFYYFILFYPYVMANFIDCTWLYVGIEDMKSAVLKNFVCRLLNVIGIFAFIHGPEDLWIYFFLIAGTTFLTMAMIYCKIGRIVSKPAFHFRSILHRIVESTKLFLPQVASLLYLQVDKVMIEWITHESSQLSFYEQSEKLINLPLSAITVLGTVIMPRIANEFSQHHKGAIKSLLLRAGRLGLFMACPMMIGLFSLSTKLIPWYLGCEFAPVSSIMMILSPIVITNTLANIAGVQYFTATDQVPVLSKAYITACVLNIICNILLIPRIGCYGAAVATVVSSLVSVLIQYYYLVKQVDMRGLLLPGIKYLIASCIMGFGIVLATRSMSATPLTTVFQVTLGCLIYGLLMIIGKDSLLLEIIKKLKDYI